MDGDVNMSDGHEPSYPAPGSAPSTPYPALHQNGNTTPHHRASLATDRNLASLTMHGAPSMGDTARGYLSLAQYFEIGRNDPHALRETRQADENHADQDDEADGNDDDGEDDDDGEEEEEDEQQPLESVGPPKPAEPTPQNLAEQDDVWTSLPGHHHLPDDDYLEARTNGAWPGRMDPAANISSPSAAGTGRGQRGSRGRGRPRGRKGWKWALKGTEHEGMFQSPKITAEAAGTKRRGRGGRPGRGSRPSRGATRGRQTAEPSRRPRADPGEAFKVWQAKATMAYLDNDLEKALEFSLQAVTENPEVPAAHFLIDQVMTAQGRHEEALQAHWMAVITSRDSHAWLAHGERLLDLAGDDKTQEDYDAAFRCFSEALKLDKNNYEIRGRKVDLFIDMKLYKHAFRECRAMMKLRPGDTDTLWKLAELLKLAQGAKKDSRTSREERAPRVIEAYRTAFNEWRGETVFGDAEMQWAHLDMYIGLLEDVGTPPNDCIRELKALSRWLLGRAHEIFWESLDDDREYDLSAGRRIATEFWRNRMVSLDDSRYGKGLPLWLRARLGCLRAKLGFLYRDEALRHLDVLLTQPSAAEDSPESFMLTAERLCALYWYQDAIKFYEAAKEQEHSEGVRFFIGMGRCYRKLERMDDAEKAFQVAVDLDNNTIAARRELARLYAETGRRIDAAKVAGAISRIGRQNIQRSEKALLAKHRALLPKQPDPSQMNRSGAVLQHLPVQSTDHDGDVRQDATEAFSTGTGDGDGEVGISDESSDEDTESLPASLAQESSPGIRRPVRKGKLAQHTHMQQLREQQTRVQTSHEMVKKLWPFLNNESDDSGEAIRQWMEHAEAMAKEFTGTKVFYPSQSSDRFVGLFAGNNTGTRQVVAEMDAMRKQMEGVSMESTDEPEAHPSSDDRTVGDFHDISFQEWHRILSDLALQYARFADQEKCNSTIDALTRGNVFRHDFALYNTTLALSIYCAIVFNDRELFLQTSRQYLYQSDYRSGMAYQVYAAAASVGYGDGPFDYDASKMQQWTQKLVKMHDILIMDPEMRDRWEWGSISTLGKEPRHQRLGRVDDGLIPGLLTTYAHIVTPKRRVHNTTSLTYLFRALTLRPDDVVVNLSLATNCIVDALRRADSERAGLDQQKTVQEGLGFFYRYYNARVATGRKCYLQEAEYNAARIWDLLGWTHLAAKGYDKVLKLRPQVREEAEKEGEEVEDLAGEAAFALQKIFIAAENEDAARAIGEEWLVL